MQRLKATIPTESPTDPDPVSRLVSVLKKEGFTAVDEDQDFAVTGEKMYRREERVLFARGETIFVLISYPSLDEKVLTQATESMANLFKARKGSDKAVSVLQSTTIYVCIVAGNESPHSSSLNKYITSVGGAVIIPVIIVPEINQVVYPAIEEKLGTVRPRLEYLQYVLGERREPARMHKQTIQTFWIAAIVVLFVIIALAFTIVT